MEPPTVPKFDTFFSCRELTSCILPSGRAPPHGSRSTRATVKSPTRLPDRAPDPSASASCSRRRQRHRESNEGGQSLPFVVTLLALVTSFILFGGIGYAHQSQMHQAQQANESETPAALAAPAVDVDLLSALTRRLADRRVNLSERLRIAAARQQWLADLIERHPAEVMRQALSPAERGSLAPEVQALVESEETHEGAIEVFHADGPQGSSYHYGLRKPSGQWLSLHFAADGPRVLTGTPVQVHGVRVQQAMALGSSSSVSVLGSPPLTNTLGEHKVLVALLTLTDTPAGAGATPVQVQSTMFGATASVSNYFREASYQQTWLTGTVVGPLPIAMSSAGCNYNQIATLAQQALAGIPSINIWNYNHVIYAFTGSGCTWWGFGSIGGSPGQVWINGAFQSVVASHELGHNFGLYHSHALECGTVTMGGSCSSVEYGDLFDVMGNGNGPTHYNAVQKDLLGWLDYGVSPPITEVVASGTYTIDGFEMPGVSPKALRIKTAVGDWLYVEYRRPVGFDSYLSSNANVSNGVIIHYWDGTGDGVYLLDMTPATSSWADPALAVGATFQDAAGKVTITPTSVNGTTATVNVTLGSTCVHAAPTVTVTPAQQQGQAGTTLTYTLTVRNNGAGCGVSVFTLQPTVPPGWTATPGVASVSLAEGATATTTLAVTSSASAS